MKMTPELLGEAFERARKHWRRRQPGETLMLPPPAVQTGYTIALSRERGSEGSAVARAIGTRLGWAVYDRELIEKIAAETGLRRELLESIDERQAHWVADWLQSFTSPKTVTDVEFTRHLRETLLALSAHGNCVIVGRGATAVLPEDTTLRVRIVAPLDIRVERVRKELGLTKQDAAKQIRETDERRAEFVRTRFLKDVADVHQNDLMLNTARLSMTQCAELVIAALRQLEGAAERQPVPQPVTA